MMPLRCVSVAVQSSSAVKHTEHHLVREHLNAVVASFLFISKTAASKRPIGAHTYACAIKVMSNTIDNMTSKQTLVAALLATVSRGIR